MSGVEAALTDEQEAVVAAPPTARLLVRAGAGTGKTHTLIERLNALVDRHDIQPGRGVLVLSFTRAAVGEIRDRVRDRGGDAAFVRARTFDSFATRSLAELDPGGAWQQTGYDARIRAALRLDLSELLDDYEHVCVDEVQDLVGPRAQLVKNILEQADCGFTLLGDPAQAIYNFTLDDSTEREEGPMVLVGWLRETFPQLEEHVLAENHRARSEITRHVWDLWPQLAGEQPDWLGIRDRLVNIFRDETEILDSDTDLRGFAQDAETRTALLFRNNGLALLQSATLRRLRIPHVVQRGASDRCVPAWVAKVLGPSEQQLLSRADFETLYAGNQAVGMPPVEIAWRNLRLAARDGPGQIRLSTLAEKIAVNHLPDELNDPPVAPLVISTIHRSKGREFERVVMPDDTYFFESSGRFEQAEETRVLFVALSRARDEIWQKDIPPVGTGYLEKDGERWTQRAHGQGGVLLGIEVTTGDVDRMFPPGGHRLEGEDPSQIQHYLSHEVHVGDEVVLEFITGTTKVDPCAFYRICHNGQTIGVTSGPFGEGLARMLGAEWKHSMRWPMRIQDVYVESVATMGGTSASTERAGLGVSGLWLTTHVSGLGRLKDLRAGSDGR
jgi:hypothetical protein